MTQPVKTVQVTDVPTDKLERARKEAVENGVSKSDSAVIRYALIQFVRQLDSLAQPETVQP